MIIAVLGKKGGVGKSTIAAHIAGWHAKEDKAVMLIDTDRQATATIWAETRIEDTDLPTPDTSHQFGANVKRMAQNLDHRYDFIVIDVGGGDGAAMKGALAAAHIAIIPFQPNELDVWTLTEVEDMIEDAKILNEQLTAIAVINRAPTHHRAADTQRALKAINQSTQMDAANIIVKDRSSIKRCVPQGLLIDEWRPKDTKATSELQAVFDITRGKNA